MTTRTKIIIASLSVVGIGLTIWGIVRYNSNKTIVATPATTTETSTTSNVSHGGVLGGLVSAAKSVLTL